MTRISADDLATSAKEYAATEAKIVKQLAALASSAAEAAGAAAAGVAGAGRGTAPTWRVGTLMSSRPWASANDFYTYMSSHGAQEISRSQARPGDVITWADAKDGVHHVAVVSSVVDGDLRYTQHTGDAVDSPLGTREGYIENWSANATAWNGSTVRVLRITQGWQAQSSFPIVQ
jgi:cell wall-associated NlpC family hydrolase